MKTIPVDTTSLNHVGIALRTSLTGNHPTDGLLRTRFGQYFVEPLATLDQTVGELPEHTGGVSTITFPFQALGVRLENPGMSVDFWFDITITPPHPVDRDGLENLVKDTVQNIIDTLCRELPPLFATLIANGAV